jgi:ankyrin repeat protein
MTTRAQMSASEKYGEGHTELMRAALEGRTKTVKALLRKGADVNAKDDTGRTSLMFAVINLHDETVKVLLEYGADVNARADDGATPVMLAALCGDPEIVRALLNRGADLSGSFVQTGKTALMLAEEHGYAGIVELLRQAGTERQA